jgi:hypothetical protein
LAIIPEDDIDFAVTVGMDKSGRPFLKKKGEVDAFRLAGLKEILVYFVEGVFQAVLEDEEEEDGDEE